MSERFDGYRDTYSEAVNESISFVGAEVDFFAALKADDLVRMIERRVGPVADLSALDVGCGVGVTDAHLVGRVGRLAGVDVSAAVLEAARRSHPTVDYREFDGLRLPFDDAALDVAFAICVFHHVDPAGRPALAAEMARVVRPGGLVAIYEHNRLNPLTRTAVARCEFDEGVALLGLRESRRLLEGAGLVVAEARYIVFFPWALETLRAVEWRLGWLPLGAQHVVTGVRPA